MIAPMAAKILQNPSYGRVIFQKRVNATTNPYIAKLESALDLELNLLHHNCKMVKVSLCIKFSLRIKFTYQIHVLS